MNIDEDASREFNEWVANLVAWPLLPNGNQELLKVFFKVGYARGRVGGADALFRAIGDYAKAINSPSFSEHTKETA